MSSDTNNGDGPQPPAAPARTVLLDFDPDRSELTGGKRLRDGLSAVVTAAGGRHLLLACDEGARLERLTLSEGGGDYGAHATFELADSLDLPAGAEEEVDVEGMDHADGFLWLVGSHSLKRGKPDRDDPLSEQLAALASVSTDGNRFLLARIPLVEGEDGAPRPLRRGEENTETSRAALLHADATGSHLTRRRGLRDDPHLGPFLGIPGKDNGFDIEGLAAVSPERLFLGLRGPVLRGFSVVLEVTVRARRTDPSELRLKGLRKHFLDIGGLGVRDLCRDGDDLLILTGPTMDLDGPVRVYRWRGAAAGDDGDDDGDGDGDGDHSVVHAGPDLALVLDLPFGFGDDHAEGMTLLPTNQDDGDNAGPRLLVVYDSCAGARCVAGGAGVYADVFALPA